jgi:hypothetical protein
MFCAAMLQARDLRLVDDSFGLDNTPALLARRYCFIFHFKPLHAIILPRRVLLFPEDGADSELGVRRPLVTADCCARLFVHIIVGVIILPILVCRKRGAQAT